MSQRIKAWLTLLGILALTALAALFVVPKGPDIKIGDTVYREVKAYLGLDLQGGAHLVYQGNFDEIPDDLREETLEAARDVLEGYVNSFGVSEARIQTNQDGRIIVELPGVQDTNEAIEKIGQTPLLEFKEEAPPEQQDENAEEEQPIIALPTGKFIPTGLSGAQLDRAETVFDPNTGEPQILLHFNDDGKQLFGEITQRNIGKRVGIYLDNEQLSAPVVQTEITNGEAVVSGAFSAKEAQQLVKRLNAGALPLPLELLSQQTVGASLGQNSFEKSLVAGAIGFIVISLFMIIYYRLPGIFAVLALSIYAAIVIALFKTLPITLTLAGVGGFLLSIGFAVDANVLIFERLKEELRNGRDLSGAIEEGFARAWTSVKDSNISTLLTCLILYVFGTSIVKGFAVTLGIGVVISIFTAVTVTRTLLRVTAGRWAQNKLWLFGVSSSRSDKKSKSEGGNSKNKTGKDARNKQGANNSMTAEGSAKHTATATTVAPSAVNTETTSNGAQRKPPAAKKKLTRKQRKAKKL